MKISTIILFAVLLISIRVAGQEMVAAKFAVASGNVVRSGTPVSASLEGVDYNTDKGALRLYEMKGKMRNEVACQLEAGNSPRLWWILEGETQANTNRKFILIKDSTFVAKNVIKTELNAKALIIIQNKQKVIQYNELTVSGGKTSSTLYCITFCLF